MLAKDHYVSTKAHRHTAALTSLHCRIDAYLTVVPCVTPPETCERVTHFSLKIKSTQLC